MDACFIDLLWAAFGVSWGQKYFNRLAAQQPTMWIAHSLALYLEARHSFWALTYELLLMTCPQKFPWSVICIPLAPKYSALKLIESSGFTRTYLKCIMSLLKRWLNKNFFFFKRTALSNLFWEKEQSKASAYHMTLEYLADSPAWLQDKLVNSSTRAQREERNPTPPKFDLKQSSFYFHVQPCYGFQSLGLRTYASLVIYQTFQAAAQV